MIPYFPCVLLYVPIYKSLLFALTQQTSVNWLSHTDTLSGANQDLNPHPQDSSHTFPICTLPAQPAVVAFLFLHTASSSPDSLLSPSPLLSLLHSLLPPPPRRPLLPFLLGAAPSYSASSEPKYSTPGAIAVAPRPGPHYGPALIAACITLFHFKESAEKPVPGRQQKVKTQLTPIRALSQAPREVMKYGSSEICNALLSGLSYNGVHANYACRLPPAPGRGPPSARPARAPASWGRGDPGGRRGGRGEGRLREG